MYQIQCLQSDKLVLTHYLEELYRLGAQENAYRHMLYAPKKTTAIISCGDWVFLTQGLDDTRQKLYETRHTIANYLVRIQQLLVRLKTSEHLLVSRHRQSLTGMCQSKLKALEEESASYLDPQDYLTQSLLKVVPAEMKTINWEGLKWNGELIDLYRGVSQDLLSC